MILSRWGVTKTLLSRQRPRLPTPHQATSTHYTMYMRDAIVEEYQLLSSIIIEADGEHHSITIGVTGPLKKRLV